MATPMLPNTAIPRAPPSSADVSEMPAAAPARSGGAEPMIRSFVSVNSGEVPRENSTDPRTITPIPEPPSIWVNTPNPTPPPKNPKPPPPRQGADGPADGEARDPDGDGLGPLPGVEEHVPDQRQCRWRQGGPGDPQHRPGRDEHSRAGGERGQHGPHPECAGADHQEPPPADPVANRPHGDQGPGHQEPVDVDDPQQLGAAGAEVRADGRHGEVQDREVHDVQHARQGDHGKADPLLASGPRRGRDRGLTLHRFPPALRGHGFGPPTAPELIGGLNAGPAVGLPEGGDQARRAEPPSARSLT